MSKTADYYDFDASRFGFAIFSTDGNRAWFGSDFRDIDNTDGDGLTDLAFTSDSCDYAQMTRLAEEYNRDCPFIEKRRFAVIPFTFEALDAFRVESEKLIA